MDSVILIITLVVSSLALIVSIVSFVSVKSGQNRGGDNGKTSEMFGEIKATLQSSNNSISNELEKGIGEKMLLVQKQFTDEAKSNASQMASFQKSISETLANNTAITNKALADSIAAINQKVDDNFKSINDRVTDSLSKGFKGTSESMAGIQERLAKIDEAQRSLDGLQKQVISLNSVLTSNEKRGQYGEMQLSLILEATFPDGKGVLYDEQYVLKKANDGNDVKPDAVIFFKRQNAILCIDSKFPLTHYANMFKEEGVEDSVMKEEKALFKSDVKDRINEVANKYIIQGLTTNQAIVFIPNDGIFAYIHAEFKDLVELALRKNVVLASPSVLQPILVTFHAAQIDAKRAESLTEINAQLKALSIDFQRFGDRWQKMEDNVSTLKKNADIFGVSVKKLNNKFTKIGSIDTSSDEEKEIAALDSIDDSDVS